MATHAPAVPPAAPAPDATTAPRRAPARERAAWVAYDFANTIWSMNIATLYFAVWLIADLGSSNTAVAVANGLSSGLVALSIPLLGAVSDARGRRMPWIIGFTLLACAATVAMAAVGTYVAPLYGEAVVGGLGVRPATFALGGAPLVALVLAFVVANYAYQAAQPFYNALLPELVPPGEMGRLSGLGTAVGYCGTIVGLLLVSPFFNGKLAGLVALPAGLVDGLRSVVPLTGHGGRVGTLVPTALLFLLFSLPIFLLVRDRRPRNAPVRMRQAFADVKRTLVDTRRYPGARRFVVASLLYQDAIGTIITFMAVYAVKAMGFGDGAEVKLFLVLTIPAIAGSYLCGMLVDRIGPKRTLMGVIAAWVVLLVAMMAAPSQAAFWVVGAGIGFIFGGVPAAERPLLMSLVPAAEAGRFFGLLMLSSRAAAIIGPFIWGFTVDALEPNIGTGAAYRAAVGAVTIAMLGALLVLRGVPSAPPGARRDDGDAPVAA